MARPSARRASRHRHPPDQRPRPRRALLHALDTLKRNIDRLGAGEKAHIRAQAVEHAPPPPRPFDLIMMDPPYGAGLAQSALDRAALWLAPGGWLSLELHGEAPILPPCVELDTTRRFGKATLLLVRRPAA